MESEQPSLDFLGVGSPLWGLFWRLVFVVCKTFYRIVPRKYTILPVVNWDSTDSQKDTCNTGTGSPFGSLFLGLLVVVYYHRLSQEQHVRI